ncbi:MAG: iron ABC transporter [Phycisphaerales bacterium]|nr:iron ABC transporter [Phycisphaerales bacterium]NNM25685.1 iron ABC transporter [Phycisphaerales bacterium]
MQWYTLDTWIVVIGVLCATACALLGNFLVLRRMSMMGDAISHAVLPGLAVAFLISGSRSSLVMFIGAGVVGLLTAVFVQWVHTFGRVDRGAAMGVVFTTLFAIGLVLIVRAAHAVDLDPGCVLYGSIELAPWDTVAVGPWLVPRAVVVLGSVLALNTLVVGVFYKELNISSFDPALATTLGINARAMQYLLMTLVAITTVAAFEAIGSILVIAMLIVPAAAAHLLTDRLGSMIAVSLVFAAVSAALGHVAAIVVPGWVGATDTMTSGMMATVAGGLFAITVLAAPRHGVVSRVVVRRRLRGRILREDALGLLYRLEEQDQPVTRSELVDRLRTALVIGGGVATRAFRGLVRRGLAEPAAESLRLTDAGRVRARQLVRTHRLWESYLYEHLAVPADHVHDTAMDLEHVTDPAMREALADHAADAAEDPHGTMIPPA